MRLTLCLRVAVLGLLSGAAPLSAHHAFAAEFDVNNPIEVHGKVSRLEFMNPHAWLYVDVEGEDGETVEWRFQLGAPDALLRLGWSTDTLSVGVEVDVTGFRAKAGGPVAIGRSFTVPAGSALFSGGSTPGR